MNSLNNTNSMNSMNLRSLKRAYLERKDEIKRRLEDFSRMRHASLDKIFLELCYCICTPLSKAEKVYEYVSEKNKELFLNEEYSTITQFLRGVCRFHKNKARYIIEARKVKFYLKKLPSDPYEAREFLVKHVKGLGYKEASHFLRNIGYRGLAILDGHIVHSLYSLGVLKTDERPKSRKDYMAAEKKMKEFAQRAGIDIDELDLLLWSMRTGRVLK